MFRGNNRQELTQRHLDAVNRDRRETALARDPSDIPGMTQGELDDVINTGSIPTALLRDIL